VSLSERGGDRGPRSTRSATARYISIGSGGEATKLMGIGIAAGLFAAFYLTHLMQALIYGVGTADPLTFLGVVAVLLFIGLIANYVPANRAMNINPTMALREE